VHALVAGFGQHTGLQHEQGVYVHRLKCPRRSPDTCTVPEMGAYVLFSALPALRLHKKIRFDVAHAHFAVPTGVSAWFLRQLVGLPYVVTAHLGDVPGGVPDQTDRLFRWVMPFTRPIWRAASHRTAVSAFVADLARRAYGHEILVIPNGLDRAIASRAPRKEGPLRLLFAGRLSVQKNLLLALRALAQIPDVAWHLDVVGDGPMRAEAEAFAERFLPPGRVTFHGWLAADELAKIRRSCDVLFMTSLSEGLPMIAVEALFDGLAIVSTDIPGMRDVLVPEKNGLVAPPEPAALANALRRFAQQPAFLESARAASLSLAPRFRLQKIVDAYEATLHAAAGAGSGPCGAVERNSDTP
jgi:glycosyltransferase involved in cell wall biosynthesis